jgi:hypothetical protein
MIEVSDKQGKCEREGDPEKTSPVPTDGLWHPINGGTLTLHRIYLLDVHMVAYKNRRRANTRDRRPTDKFQPEKQNRNPNLTNS